MVSFATSFRADEEIDKVVTWRNKLVFLLKLDRKTLSSVVTYF